MRLIGLIESAFRAAGGNFNAGRDLRTRCADVGIESHINAEIVALAPGHPYLRLPLQFAAALRTRMLTLVEAPELDALLAAAEAELRRPDVWGTTFTLIQAYGRTP